MCEWQAIPLRDLSLAIRDGTHGTHQRVEIGVPLLSAKNVGSDGRLHFGKEDDRISEADFRAITSTFSPQAGDLLLTVVGTLGRAAVFDGARVAFQRSVAFVRPNGRVHPRFLYQACTTEEFQRQLHRRSNVTAQAGLYLGELAKTRIPVPPFADQERILEILTSLDTAIEKTEALIAKHQQIKAGLMHDLFARGVLPDGNHRPSIAWARDLYVESAMGPQPADWQLLRCADLCTRICVGIVIQPTQYYVEEGVPALRSANVREEGVDPSNLVHISSFANGLLAKSQIRANDIVTVRTGYPGTSAVVPTEFDGANCIDIIISTPGTGVLPKYLCYWVNSDFGKGQVLIQQGGAAQQHFNVGEMRELLVRVPPLAEQALIVAKLDAASEQVRSEVSRVGKLRQLKRGLMQSLLAGPAGDSAA